MTRAAVRPVTVQYFKYPDILHWRHDMRYLGEDEHGVWLGAPAGSTVQRGTEPSLTWPTPFVQLVPHRGWFTLLGNPQESKHSIYVDVVTEPQWTSSNRIEMVDLDLDVVRDCSGMVRLLDEDEFLTHQATLEYPEWMVQKARVTAVELVLAAEQMAEPFGDTPQRWLDELDRVS